MSAPNPAAPQRLRLGLPWWLPHYQRLNGAHPLAMAYLDGNPLIEPVRLEAMEAVPVTALDAVAPPFAEHLLRVPPASLMQWLEWAALGEQAAVEAQGDRYDLLMHHTTPLYSGRRPWIFHFENFVTLFAPFMLHGHCRGVVLRGQPWFERVRATLESPYCVGIFSHLHGSLQTLNRVFGSPAIASKCHRVTLSIAPPSAGDPMAKFADGGGPLRILFTNSLHRHPTSFYLRGGHHLLAAFARLRREHPQAQLTVLSPQPPDLLRRVPADWFQNVVWLEHRVDEPTLESLFLSHHVFALPAAGLHTGSLLRAFSHGCVPIVPDAPGYAEYVADTPDSVMTLRGVRERVYRDEPEGWTSDRYDDFVRDDETLTSRLHALLAEHADPARLAAMARRNLGHWQERHSVRIAQADFNRMLVGG